MMGGYRQFEHTDRCPCCGGESDGLAYESDEEDIEEGFKPGFDFLICGTCQGKLLKEVTPPGGCDLTEYPTPEEIAADEKWAKERHEKIGKARNAIVENLGGPWTEKKPTSGRGVIDCPVCSTTQSLQFTRSGYNGHIHASCSKEGCVSWME